MPKYRVETDKGNYLVETEDPPSISASGFTPPPPSSWEGPASGSTPSGGFVPPPPSAWEGPAKKVAPKMDQSVDWAAEAAKFGGSTAPPGPSRTWLDDVGDYFKGEGKEAGETLGGVIPSINQAFYHPLDTISNIGKAQGDVADQATKAFKAGDYATGVRHSLEYLIPILGPKLAQLGNQAGSGEPGALPEALGRATTLGLSLAAPAVIPRATGAIKAAVPNIVRRMIPNVNNATEEAALAAVEPKVDMSVGQRMGQPGLQRVESGLENFPGSANRATQFYANQEDQLADAGRDVAASAGGQQTNAVGAGQAIGQRLTQRISRLKSQADKFYGDVRNAAAANQQTVQVGSNASPILGPNGQPLQTPVMQTFETPVDMAPYRANLKPVYDDLMRAMPEARRAASPAFQALSNLVNDPQPFMNAMDFDKSLGAIKAIARNGDNPFLTSQSQGIARKMIGQGEQQLKSALNGAGPDVVRTLQSARGMVKSYYDTGELLADLNDEPAALYQNLVSGGDRSFNTLTSLKSLAPHELRTVGRTFLDGLMDKATKEGGFGRAAGIYADWNRLGPEAKQLMFGPQLTGDVDNFLLAAKRLTTPHNPSGTAHMVAALHRLGAVGTAIGGLLTGNPWVAAGAIGESFVAPNIAARFLFDPNNAKLLNRALRVGPRDLGFSSMATALNARFLQANQQPPPQQQDLTVVHSEPLPQAPPPGGADSDELSVVSSQPLAAAPAQVAQAPRQTVTEGSIIRHRSNPSVRLIFRNGEWQPLNQ
jgi:hypothetical protein